MIEARQRIPDRLRAGLVAMLVGSALLLTGGVEAVRAEAPAADAEATPETPLRVVPSMKDGALEVAPRPENPRAESAPGVIVLNTRGYNYGPNRPTAMPAVDPGDDDPSPAAPTPPDAR